MIMIVKTPGSQMGSPAAAEEGGEEVGGGRWESGECLLRSNLSKRSKTVFKKCANSNLSVTRPGP